MCANHIFNQSVRAVRAVRVPQLKRHIATPLATCKSLTARVEQVGSPFRCREAQGLVCFGCRTAANFNIDTGTDEGDGITTVVCTKTSVRTGYLTTRLLHYTIGKTALLYNKSAAQPRCVEPLSVLFKKGINCLLANTCLRSLRSSVPMVEFRPFNRQRHQRAPRTSPFQRRQHVLCGATPAAE